MFKIHLILTCLLLTSTIISVHLKEILLFVASATPQAEKALQDRMKERFYSVNSLPTRPPRKDGAENMSNPLMFSLLSRPQPLLY